MDGSGGTTPLDEADGRAAAGWTGALFGSQFLFFSASAASCSALRCGTLLTKGTGTLAM